MNNAGEIVGWGLSNNTTRASLCQWRSAQPRIARWPGLHAHGINARDRVVGSAATAAGEEHAFFYFGGQMIDIGTLGGTQSRAVAINSSGLVTGFSATSDGSCHLFVWQNGVRSDAGHLGLTDCEVWDLNTAGRSSV